MSYEQSIILGRTPTLKAKHYRKERRTMAKLKETKVKLREVKANAVAAKKQVNPALKAFTEDPLNKARAAAYRGAVSTHISLVRQTKTLQTRVDRLAAA